MLSLVALWIPLLPLFFLTRHLLNSRGGSRWAASFMFTSTAVKDLSSPFRENCVLGSAAFVVESSSVSCGRFR